MANVSLLGITTKLTRAARVSWNMKQHRHRGVEFAISNLRFFGTTVRRVANRTTDPSYLHVAGAASGDYPRLFVLPVVDGRECWRA